MWSELGPMRVDAANAIISHTANAHTQNAGNGHEHLCDICQYMDVTSNVNQMTDFVVNPYSDR